MARDPGDRTRFWPAIEARYGQPMSHWFDAVAGSGDGTYAAQMALLQDGHGFSRSHANAVVMYCRGSATSRRVADVDAYLAPLDPTGAATIRRIITAIQRAHPGTEAVIAWNQPMLRMDGHYVFGLSAARGHILLAPWGDGVLASFAPRLEGYTVNKKTIRVPLDWEVDADLLADLVSARLAQIGGDPAP